MSKKHEAHPQALWVGIAATVVLWAIVGVVAYVFWAP